jgi:hypothetical protein
MSDFRHLAGCEAKCCVETMSIALPSASLPSVVLLILE